MFDWVLLNVPVANTVKIYHENLLQQNLVTLDIFFVFNYHFSNSSLGSIQIGVEIKLMDID